MHASTCVSGVHACTKPDLVLIVEVGDHAVRMVVLLVVKRVELGKIIPVTIILISHVITNTAWKQLQLIDDASIFNNSHIQHDPDVSLVALRHKFLQVVRRAIVRVDEGDVLLPVAMVASVCVVGNR